MSETRVVERLADRRTTLAFPVRIEVEGVEGAEDFTATNLSAGGIFVSTEHPYPEGTRLSLEMSLPVSEQPVRAKGTVVRRPQYNEEEGAAGMGIEFTPESRTDIYFLAIRMES